ncbi:MAG: hypothetical protein RM022_027850 [Nostoc sp. EfeVER01]|uniref:hypothetical protein n=1 Tax=Nostoc sp. EfeVER01 TaxID=3075406 RepID=UPI002AD532A8|nr:hypothetical protein [Nostoc sp. EfeVER01]MDZ7945432.1 hypothetical protein [Nostoc sp. EfeVER01]
MEESAVNPLNGGVLLSAGVPNSVSSFAPNGSLSAEGSLLTGSSNLLLGNGNNPIPGGGINPFAGDAGSGLQQLIFDRLKSILGDNFFKGIDNTLAGGSNPFANSGYTIPGGATNPFAGGSNPFLGGGNAIPGGSNPIASAGSLLQQSPFDPLKEVLGNNQKC